MVLEKVVQRQVPMAVSVRHLHRRRASVTCIGTQAALVKLP
jgi:hypothetical protein